MTMIKEIGAGAFLQGQDEISSWWASCVRRNEVTLFCQGNAEQGNGRTSVYESVLVVVPGNGLVLEDHWKLCCDTGGRTAMGQDRLWPVDLRAFLVRQRQLRVSQMGRGEGGDGAWWQPDDCTNNSNSAKAGLNGGLTSRAQCPEHPGVSASSSRRHKKTRLATVLSVPHPRSLSRRERDVYSSLPGDVYSSLLGDVYSSLLGDVYSSLLPPGEGLGMREG